MIQDENRPRLGDMRFSALDVVCLFLVREVKRERFLTGIGLQPEAKLSFPWCSIQ